MENMRKILCIREIYKKYRSTLHILHNLHRLKTEVNMSIERPDYYKGNGYEPKDVIHAWGLNFNLGNVIKYVERAGKKSSVIDDLLKARQYLDFEIEVIIDAEKNA